MKLELTFPMTRAEAIVVATEGVTWMVNDILGAGDKRKAQAVEAFKRDLTSVSTGRANQALVDGILVDYYGVMTPIQQLASITVPDARMLVLEPWDKTVLPAIEKALLKDTALGLNPLSDGKVLRLPIPQLTEDRRKQLVRVVREKTENAKVEIRNLRRSVLEEIRGQEKDKEISEDESKRAQVELQKNTDRHVAQIISIGESKEKEVMEV